MGSTGTDTARVLTTDSLGNVYVAGNYNGTVDFDPSVGVDMHTSAGLNDIFVTKINADGSYGYTKTMGSVAGTDGAQGLATDSADNIYVSGNFAGTVDFDFGAGTDSFATAGGNDIFLTKINADGSYGYTKTIGSTGSDIAYGLTSDSADNIYLAGQFAVTVDFDPGAGTDSKVSAGGTDIFLTKINADGSYGYTKTMGGTGTDIAFSLDKDSADNIYIAGQFSTTVDFDPGAGTDSYVSAGGTDIFLTKINADGSYGYTKTMGGTGGDIANRAVVDSSDNVYVAGQFSTTVDFDPGAGTDSYVSAGGTDIFLTKINADGSYGYTKTMGSTGGDLANRALDTDSAGNVYLAGQFSVTVDFDPGAGTDSKVSAGGTDIFLTKINADGSYAYTKTMGGTGGDNANALTTDLLDNIYIAGQFSTTVDFDPDAGTDSKVSAGGTDIFLTKFTRVNYYHITNLTPNLSASTIDGTSVDDETIDAGVLQGETITVRLFNIDGLPIADILTTFNSDLDWSSMSGDSDPAIFKSYVQNAASESGTSGTYILYVPYKAGDNFVVICPNVSSLDQISVNCSGGLVYDESDDNVSIVTIGTNQYWQIEGLTYSAGGMSTDSVTLAPTGESTQQLMVVSVVLMTAGIFSILWRRKLHRRT